MPRNVKRRISSLSYSINRFYRKISTTKPSTIVLSAIVIAAAIFLFGGGLYNLINRPYPYAYINDRFYFLLTRELTPQALSDQLVFGSIIAIILYSLGTIGVLAVYQSTKYVYKPRQAYLMFLIGVVFLIMAYIFLEVIIKMKTGG